MQRTRRATQQRCNRRRGCDPMRPSVCARAGRRPLLTQAAAALYCSQSARARLYLLLLCEGAQSAMHGSENEATQRTARTDPLVGTPPVSTLLSQPPRHCAVLRNRALVPPGLHSSGRTRERLRAQAEMRLACLASASFAARLGRGHALHAPLEQLRSRPTQHERRRHCRAGGHGGVSGHWGVQFSSVCVLFTDAPEDLIRLLQLVELSLSNWQTEV